MSILDEIRRPVEGTRVRVDAARSEHHGMLGTVIDTRAGAPEEVTVHLDGPGEVEILIATYNLDIVDALPTEPRELAIVLAVADAEDIAAQARAQFGADAARLIDEAESHAATSQQRSMTRLDVMRCLDEMAAELNRLLDPQQKLDRISAYPPAQAASVNDGLDDIRAAVAAVREQASPNGGARR